ncbi:pseudouridine synthase [Propioniciclava soli]|uniref:pseudouridine synthase n=1 Tax=Propioniciclava soli TaxID=2775081 RepID=UPI001E6351EB|nr:pseudouridine synthase [Propioniciclava soli]
MGRRRARSPLPPRDGLDAVWVRTPARIGSAPNPWPTLPAFLRDRLPAVVPVDAWVAAGRFVTAAGTPVASDTPYTPATLVWFHKDPTEEQPPAPLAVLHAGERLVVVDKPPFLATIPRGAFVRRSALVQARVQLGLPELAPAHRLDRLTAGVLVFTTEPRWRAAYQTLFADRAVRKTYEALAPSLDLAGPLEIRNHLVKRRASRQVEVVPGAAPNSETRITLLERRDALARYRLEPATGRTHQLRVHLAGLGAPIVDDPLYPDDRLTDDAPEDPARPLRLLAQRIDFTDPVDGTHRTFTSRHELAWPDQSTAPGL